MSSGQKWLHARARPIAERVLEYLTPACSRIEIAGSIRRNAVQVSDIEIVCVPRVRADLFGEPTGECELSMRIRDGMNGARFRWRNETHGKTPADPRQPRRFYSLVALPDGLPLDVFAVRPPAQWGAIFAIRTGPADFSRKLVTEVQRFGLACEEGRLIRTRDRQPTVRGPEDKAGATYSTPEERDFLAACGSRWIEPQDRR